MAVRDRVGEQADGLQPVHERGLQPAPRDQIGERVVAAPGREQRLEAGAVDIDQGLDRGQ